MNAKISIVVPVYNVSPYLKECLDSICRQTYENIEILVVNDGSTDDSGKICDQYTLKDSRVKVYHKKNGGLSDARNYGLVKATGLYVTFIDSDDFVTEDYVEQLYRLLSDYDSDIAIASFYYLYETGKFKRSSVEEQFEQRLTPAEVMEKLYQSKEVPPVTYSISWGKLYKAELFKEIKFPVGKIHEDEFTTYKLYLESKTIVYSNKPLYYYRQRSGSITNRPYSLAHLDGLEAIEERIDYLKKRDYPIRQTELAYLGILSHHLYYLKKYGYRDKYKKFSEKYHYLAKKLSPSLVLKERLKLLLKRYLYGIILLKHKKKEFD